MKYHITYVAKKDGVKEEFPFVGTGRECNIYEMELYANGWDVSVRHVHAVTQ